MAAMTNVAHPYANALFDLSNADSTVDLWLSDLQNLANVAYDINFISFIDNPGISSAHLLETLFGFVKNTGPTMRNFINLLINESRLNLLPEIYTLFNEKVAVMRNSASAIIQSAFPMNEKDRNDFEDLLTKKLDKKVSVVVEVDRELIGGVKILVNDLVIDASVKGSLEKLAAKII